MNKYESNKIEKILKAVCAKIARWVGRLANRPSSSTDKFVNYQEHMGKGLTLEIREQSAGIGKRNPEIERRNIEIERQKIAIEDRKVTKRLRFALMAWKVTSWIGGITAIFLMLYALLLR